MNASGTDLQRHAVDTWQVIRNRLGLIIASTLLVFAVAVIVTYIMPRKYRGVVEMRIERVADKIPVFDRNATDSLVMTEQWIKTEIGTINKSETLYPVVDAMNLVQRWQVDTRQLALVQLKANLSSQSEMRSDIVKIEYYDQDRQLAADIANAVADSYMNRRVEVERGQKEEALGKLEKQIADQETLARSARERKLAAKKAAGILGEGFFNSSMSRMPGFEVSTGEEAMAMTRQQELLRLEVETQAYEADLAELTKLSPDELVSRASAMKIENPILASLQADLNKFQVEMEGVRNAGLGARHPKVLGLQAQITKNSELILEAAQAHIAGLENKLAAAKTRQGELERYNDASKEDALEQQASYSDYLTISRELEQIEELLLKLKERYSEEKSGINLVKSPATILATAEAEMRPAKPSVAINLALGGVLGIMLGVGLAFGLESLDTTVKSLDDVERVLGVPVLAVIPKEVGVLHRSNGFNPDAEAYRILRTNIEFNRRDPKANCITVVSGGAGEGKSTTLTNLAYVCAQGGYNVLLIDGDLRRPRLHTLFDAPNTVGLSNYLTTNVPLEEVVTQTPVENLYFLPSGLLPSDSAGILNSQRMSELIEDVKARFDLVLIDSPPILGVSDASVLVNEADLTMIVVQHRKLPQQMLMRVKQAVENVGGNVLGVVLNNVDTRSDSQYQYYTSYYTYYSPNNAPAASGGPAPERKRKRRKIEPKAASTTRVEPKSAAPSDSDHPLLDRVTASASKDDHEDLF